MLGIGRRSSVSPVPSLSFLHWSGPQPVVPAGANRSSEIVFLVRFQNRVGRFWVSAVAAATVSAMNRAGARSVAVVSFIRASLTGRSCSLPKLSRRKSFHAVESRAGKFGAGRLSSGQIGVGQISAGEIRVRQIRSRKISALKLGELEIHVRQFRAFEISAGEIRT